MKCTSLPLLKRREFIALLGGGPVAWPLAARAQQQPATIPVVGFLGGTSPETFGDRLRAFRQGLKESGYTEGENVRIEYRWANDDYSLLRVLAKELVDHRVAVIVTAGGHVSALAAH